MVGSAEGKRKSFLSPANWGDIEKHLEPLLKDRRFNIEIVEHDIIDSSNVKISHWIDLSQEIEKNYRQFSGFIIIHGTDTMAYTASALSFLLENISKPVILTGSQLPLSTVRTDAIQNLAGALMLTLHNNFQTPIIPEVCIFFNNILFRGNRTRKVSAYDFHAFSSPNYPTIGSFSKHFELNQRYARLKTSNKVILHETMDSNVLMCEVYPGMPIAFLRSIFAIERLKGVILKTYGAGNTPSDDDFLMLIDEAVNQTGLVICNVTQCMRGSVDMQVYGTGSELQKTGVICGFDMTPEAAFTKMQFLFGCGYDKVTVESLMQKNLRGELTEQS
ncbi:MAG: asparaginase domain-containing protein [Candidatus Magnetoovum sp. WYHC-5]|nr:asparaginase domain-containing protein [Candidatus Magnetoovum sp. WYHC-5]